MAAMISLALFGCGGGGDGSADPIGPYAGTWTRCEGGLGALSTLYTLKVSKQGGSQASVELRSDVVSPGCAAVGGVREPIIFNSTMQLNGGTKTVGGRLFDKAVFTAGTFSRKELIGLDGQLRLSFLPQSPGFDQLLSLPRDAEGYPETAELTFVRASAQ